MRAAVRIFPLLLLTFLLPAAAMADSLDSASPASFNQYAVEEGVTLTGTNLLGSVATFVNFDGPAGTFSTEVFDGLATEVFVPMPDPVLAVPGRYSVTVTAQDAAAVRTIGPVFIDVIARPPDRTPSLALPEIVSAPATNTDGAVVTFTVSAHSYDGTPLTPVCDRTSGADYPIGSTRVTCSATDSFGSVTGNFLIVVADSDAPVLTVPGNIVSDSQIVNYTATAVDAIEGSITPVCSPASGSTFNFGTTTVDCSASDSHANTAHASFLVTVRGGTPPSLVLPGDFSIEATGSSGVNVTYTTGTDADATVLCTPPSGMVFPVGTTTVQCFANGPSGSTYGTFNVTVTDTTPPTLNVPADIAIDGTSSAGAVVTYYVSASDLVDGSAQVTCTPASGSTFPNGATTVNCSATDSHNNRGTGSFHVTVRSIAPSLTLPNDFTVEATAANGATVTYVVTTDPDATAVCTPPSGSTFALGLTTVNCTATNNGGGSTSGSFKVTVADRTPPVLTLPSNITKEGNTLGGATVSFSATAHDTVDGNVTVACTPASGSTFAVGTATVNCSATDAHSNSSTGSFTVTVTDTTGPALSLPANITAEATSSTGAAVTYSASANDLVEGSKPVTCDHASGSNFAFGTTTVQCTAADSRGNMSAGSFTVTVRDTTGPVLTLPATIVAEADSFLGDIVTYTASASDAVSGPAAVTCTPASGSLFPIGPTTVNCSAKDALNNVSHGSFIVDVEDRTAPVITAIQALPDHIWPANNQMAHVFVLAVALDRVDVLSEYHIISVTSNQPTTGPGADFVITGPATVDLRASRTNNVERIYTITIRATDHAGNSSTATVDVHVAPGRRRP